jgi:hypothetical protein
MKLLDIHAAYPSAMASRDVALDLRLVHSSTTLDPSEAGLARASVFVPRELPHPPLPVRIGPEAIQFQWGHIKGVWSWVELDLARRLGCDVKVQEVWAPGRTTDLFGAWWGEAQTGRSLEGKASKLAKAIANSTWGQFAMRGDQRSEVSWADDRGNEEYEIELPPKSMPQRWGIHIASEITARVRTQMLEEGMYGIGGSIHADTDGVIVPVGSASPKNFGKGFGSWQTKELMKTVDLRAPQLYRFTRLADGAGDWKYVASGMRPDMARKIFEKGVLGTNISYLDISDKCLPPADADEQEMLDAIYKEAKSLGVL